MVILCVESSGNICSAALSVGADKVFSSIVSTTGEHASLLTTAIGNVMAEAGVAFSGLDAVAVSAGPGSYTGLRIGASTAKGICYANDVPLIAVPTLEIIAEELFSKSSSVEYALPMIDARRMEVYCAVLDRNFKYVSQTEAKILDSSSFAELFKHHRVALGGSGADKFKPIVSSANASFIDDSNAKAQYMVRSAERKFSDKEFADVAYFEPFYLKEYVAVVSKNKVLEDALKQQ